MLKFRRVVEVFDHVLLQGLGLKRDQIHNLKIK
jgi:hypothetical protein